MNEGDTIRINQKFSVNVFPTQHRVPSQGYAIISITTKLLPEYEGMTPLEISHLRRDGVDVKGIKSFQVVCARGG